jgi:hypothetical protein
MGPSPPTMYTHIMPAFTLKDQEFEILHLTPLPKNKTPCATISANIAHLCNTHILMKGKKFENASCINAPFHLKNPPYV